MLNPAEQPRTPSSQPEPAQTASDPTLKIAIQKSGRLSEKSLKLLKDCGIKVSSGNRKLSARASNFPLEVLFLRDDDIPQYVERGVADVGILGENEMLERGRPVKLVKRLGFAGCRMSLAVPRGVDYPGLAYFRDKTVATSYPRVLKNYFDQHRLNTEIEEIGGSVEIAPGIGLADGIFDIVSTGSTLLSNGLKEVEVVLRSEAVLIATENLASEKQALLDRILFRLAAVHEAGNNKYILMNAPDEAVQRIIDFLPGMRSPTVLPLAQAGWSSVHTVIGEDDFWESIDELKRLGAEGILVAPIEKMIL